MKVYTGIGSRQTPKDILTLMHTIGGRLAVEGWTLRSGGAKGADTAFEHGALENNGATEIYIPWRGFNGRLGGKYEYVNIAPEAYRITSKFHPAWDRVSPGARKLHARNVHQVLGPDLKKPSAFVICWTPDGGITGGTGQAIRIALNYGVPIFNLYDRTTRYRLERFGDKGGKS